MAKSSGNNNFRVIQLSQLGALHLSSPFILRRSRRKKDYFPLKLINVRYLVILNVAKNAVKTRFRGKRLIFFGLQKWISEEIEDFKVLLDLG